MPQPLATSMLSVHAISHTHRKYTTSVLLILITILLAHTACTPEAKSHSGMTVTIDVQPTIISSGFMTVHFSTNKEAYYLVGILRPEYEGFDTLNTVSTRSFMLRTLDNAYSYYISWRNNLLLNEVPYIAEFPTHALQYGEVDYTFTYLSPDAEYWVYAFVVNTVTNKPDGRIFIKPIYTTATTTFEDVQFEYRIRGPWEYIYPTNNDAHTIPEVPWARCIFDSLTLRSDGCTSAKTYCQHLLQQYQCYRQAAHIHFGILVKNYDNDSFADTDAIEQDVTLTYGHTYYTGMALMDGYSIPQATNIYKFTWYGEDTNAFFTDSLNLQTDW